MKISENSKERFDIVKFQNAKQELGPSHFETLPAIFAYFHIEGFPQVLQAYPINKIIISTTQIF